MRFSLVALFLLSVIVVDASRFKFRARSNNIPKYVPRKVQPTYNKYTAINRNPGYSSGAPHSYPASSALSGNSYNENVHQTFNPKSGSGVNRFARLLKTSRYSSTVKPYYGKIRSGNVSSLPALSALFGNAYSESVHQKFNPKSGSGVNRFARIPKTSLYSSTVKPYYGMSRSGDARSHPASSGLSGITNSDNARPALQQQQNIVHQHPWPTYRPRTVHHPYHYNPPQQIRYGSTFHPVYQGHPPVYVYEYRNSGSRFDNLLTGLALYNLGRNSHYHHYNSDRQYSTSPGEICKLGISKQSGAYEETLIDCNLMSSFIWDDSPSTTRNEQQTATETMTSSSVEDALKMKGSSIQVTPGMSCSLIRTFGDTTTMRRYVDCGLLQEYALSVVSSIMQSTSKPEVNPFRRLTYTERFTNPSTEKVHVDEHHIVLKNDSKHNYVNLSDSFLEEHTRRSFNRNEEVVSIPNFTLEVDPAGKLVYFVRPQEHHKVGRHPGILKNGYKNRTVTLQDVNLKNISKNVTMDPHHAIKNTSGSDSFRRLPALFKHHNNTNQQITRSGSRQPKFDQRHLVTKNTVNTNDMHQSKNAKSSVYDPLRELRLAGWFDSSNPEQHHNVDQPHIVLKNRSQHYNASAFYGQYNSSKHNVDLQNLGLKNYSKQYFVNLNHVLEEHARRLFNRSEEGLSIPQPTFKPEVNRAGKNKNAKSALENDALRSLAALLNLNDSKLHPSLDQYSEKSGSNIDNVLQNGKAKRTTDEVFRRLPLWLVEAAKN